MVLRKCRWLRLLPVLPILLLTPVTSAWAVGLSEIEVDSALNERFSASIDLLDADDLGDGEIIVSLASREDFERIGVERFFFLTDLQFSVDLDGTPKIVVSSGKSISEPYLNFIVEVIWPKGRLLKEYTILWIHRHLQLLLHHRSAHHLSQSGLQSPLVSLHVAQTGYA